MSRSFIEAANSELSSAIAHHFPDLHKLFQMLGLMGWPLLLCALIIGAIFLERFFFIVTTRLSREKTYLDLKQEITKYKSDAKPLRDEVISLLLNNLQLRYLSSLGLLKTISIISPMLGLLGTILGIISAFKVIAAQTGAISPSLIADGLWEAMLTTAAGLMIALPAIMSAHIFKFYADKELHLLCQRLNQLSLSYALQVQKGADD